jgi:plasmid stabilization system protein ParE
MGMFDGQLAEAVPMPGQPIPIKVKVADPSEFPLEALSPKLRAAVLAVRDKAQVPDAIAAQSVLGAAALATQCRVNIALPTGEVMPSSLFLFTVAGSGERKTSADKWALTPFYRRERELRAEYIEKAQAYEIDLAAYSASVAEAKRTGKKDRNAIRENLKECGKPPMPPPGPDLLVEEPTMQAIVKMMADAMPSLGLFSDEGAQFLGGYSMNEENQAASGAQLSQFWDGKTIKRIRAGEKQLVQYLVGRRLSVHLMVQPDVALKVFSNKAIRSQGLMSRMLCCFPKSLKGQRMWQDPSAETEQALHRYWSHLEYLLQAPMTFADEATRELRLDDMKLTPEARQAYIHFNDHIERQLGPGGALEEIADIASKLAQHAMRLACVTAYFENGHDHRKCVETGITANAFAVGVRLAQFYAAEALRLYNAGSVDEDSDNAADLIAFIRGREMVVVGHRWLSQNCPKPIRPAVKLGRAVGLLEEWGHLCAIKGGGHFTVSDRQGQSKELYERRAYTVVPAED